MSAQYDHSYNYGQRMILAPHPNEVWSPAYIISTSKKNITVRYLDDSESNFSGDADDYPAYNPNDWKKIPTNIQKFVKCDEAHIIHGLQSQFQKNLFSHWVNKSTIISMTPSAKSLLMTKPADRRDVFVALRKHLRQLDCPANPVGFATKSIYDLITNVKNQTITIFGETAYHKSYLEGEIINTLLVHSSAEYFSYYGDTSSDVPDELHVDEEDDAPEDDDDDAPEDDDDVPSDEDDSEVPPDDDSAPPPSITSEMTGESAPNTGGIQQPTFSKGTTLHGLSEIGAAAAIDELQEDAILHRTIYAIQLMEAFGSTYTPSSSTNLSSVSGVYERAYTSSIRLGYNVGASAEGDPKLQRISRVKFDVALLNLHVVSDSSAERDSKDSHTDDHGHSTNRNDRRGSFMDANLFHKYDPKSHYSKDQKSKIRKPFRHRDFPTSRTNYWSLYALLNCEEFDEQAGTDRHDYNFLSLASERAALAAEASGAHSEDWHDELDQLRRANRRRSVADIERETYMYDASARTKSMKRNVVGEQNSSYVGRHIERLFNFDQILTTMKAIGFSESECKHTYKLCLAVLLLGNLEFVQVFAKEKRSKGLFTRKKAMALPKVQVEVVRTSQKSLSTIQTILAVSDGVLEEALGVGIPQPEENTSDEKPLRASKHARDVLADFIYGRVFEFIIFGINRSLSRVETVLQNKFESNLRRRMSIKNNSGLCAEDYMYITVVNNGSLAGKRPEPYFAQVEHREMTEHSGALLNGTHGFGLDALFSHYVNDRVKAKYDFEEVGKLLTLWKNDGLLNFMTPPEQSFLNCIPHATMVSALMDGAEHSGSGVGVGLVKFLDKVTRGSESKDNASLSNSMRIYNDTNEESDKFARHLIATFGDSKSSTGNSDNIFASQLYRHSLSTPDIFFVEHWSCSAAYSCDKWVEENANHSHSLISFLNTSRNPIASLRATWSRKTVNSSTSSLNKQNNVSNIATSSEVDDGYLEQLLRSQTVCERAFSRFHTMIDEAFRPPDSKYPTDSKFVAVLDRECSINGKALQDELNALQIPLISRNSLRGFDIHFTHEDFLRRYSRILSVSDWRHAVAVALRIPFVRASKPVMKDVIPEGMEYRYLISEPVLSYVLKECASGPGADLSYPTQTLLKNAKEKFEKVSYHVPNRRNKLQEKAHVYTSLIMSEDSTVTMEREKEQQNNLLTNESNTSSGNNNISEYSGNNGNNNRDVVRPYFMPPPLDDEQAQILVVESEQKLLALRNEALCLALLQTISEPLNLKSSGINCSGSGLKINLSNSIEGNHEATSLTSEGKYDWLVGRSRVFLRGRDVQLRLEEARGVLMQRAAIRIQRWRRGNKIKKRFMGLWDVVFQEVRRLNQERREMEKLRSEKDRAYQSALRHHKSNFMHTLNHCAKLLQRYIRTRRLQRYTLSIGICNHLTAALKDLTESSLEHAISVGINYLNKWGDKILLRRGYDHRNWKTQTAKTRSKIEEMGSNESNLLAITIRVGDLVSNCMDVVTDVRAHSYVRQELKEALRTGNKVMLGDAIRLAKGLDNGSDKARAEGNASRLNIQKGVDQVGLDLTLGNNTNKKKKATSRSSIFNGASLLQEAMTRKLQEISVDDMLDTLKSELLQCVSIARLVGKADSLTCLVNTILEVRCQLSSNPVIVDAVTRLCRIQSLIVNRNLLRLAIELCSERGILHCLEKRENLVKLYGDALFHEEYCAARDLLRILEYQRDLEKDSWWEACHVLVPGEGVVSVALLPAGSERNSSAVVDEIHEVGQINQGIDDDDDDDDDDDLSPENRRLSSASTSSGDGRSSLTSLAKSTSPTIINPGVFQRSKSMIMNRSSAGTLDLSGFDFDESENSSPSRNIFQSIGGALLRTFSAPTQNKTQNKKSDISTIVPSFGADKGGKTNSQRISRTLDSDFHQESVKDADAEYFVDVDVDQRLQTRASLADMRASMVNRRASYKVEVPTDASTYPSDESFILATCLLPPFVSSQLERYRQTEMDGDTTAAHQLDRAFSTLIKDVRARSTLKTIFKWIVAFATWRYQTPAMEVLEENSGGSSLSPLGNSNSNSNPVNQVPAAITSGEYSYSSSTSSGNIDTSLPSKRMVGASLSKLRVGEVTLAGARGTGRGYLLSQRTGVTGHASPSKNSNIKSSKVSSKRSVNETFSPQNSAGSGGSAQTYQNKNIVRSPVRSKTIGQNLPFSNKGRGGGGSHYGAKKQVRGQTARMVKQAQELYADIVNKGFS